MAKLPVLSRRGLLKTSAAAATFFAARAALPAGAFAQAGGPEVKTANLGFIALTDAAPLIVAKEKGLFAKYGMPDVQVMKQASWGATRDNIELGSGAGGIDGAHILTPMPYLISLGKVTKNNQKLPMYILARLNTNGQAISLAKAHKGAGITTDAKALKGELAKLAAAGKEAKCAMTFPGGTHDLWIRYWLASAGIDPDKDIGTIVVPPAQMVANMKVGTMVAFCVGEPWNLQLVHQDIGYSALVTGELWKNHPEKSFGMRADWVDKHPKAAKALLMAVQEAQRWIDTSDATRKEMCEIIAKRDWLKVPVEDIVDRSLGNIDYGDGRKAQNSPLLMKFWREQASFPFKSHEQWFLTEDIRWGYLPPDLDRKATVDAVNREDLWREAAKAIGVPDAEIPQGSSRGIETFFDGKTFDPADPDGYLRSLTIRRTGNA